MNRRQLITATLPSLGLLLANNRLALARVQEMATPGAAGRSKPEIELVDYSHEEAVYLGTLTTWLEMLEDSNADMYDAIDGVIEDPESRNAMAAILLPLGVWSYLGQDAQKFEGPLAFSLVQHYAVSALTHLGSAADIISAGVVSTSATAVTLGTEHINLAAEDIGKLMAALPFERPRRSEFFD